MNAIARLRARLRRRAPADELERIAGEVDRLAALVGAGATPHAAWRYLASTAGEDGDRLLAGSVAEAARAGSPLAPVFGGLAPGATGDAWRRVGAAAGLAAELGAPQGPALHRAAHGLRAAAELHRAVAAAVSGPAASARLIMVLPAGAALLGWAFGFDVPGVLLGSPIGLIALAAGLALLAGALLWSRRLIRAAGRVAWERGLGVELAAVGVRAGLPASRARIEAAVAARDAGVDVAGDQPAIDAVLAFAAEAGIPVAALLDAEADRVRRAVLAQATGTATLLAVRLLIPLGLLVLPAFLLLGAVPIGVAVLDDATTGL